LRRPSSLLSRKRPFRVPARINAPTSGKKLSRDRVQGRSSRRRRETMAKLTDEQREFLDNHPYVGTVTTLREDGSPHSTIVWIDTENGYVSFNTAAGRAKERHLRQDPRVSVLVVDPENPYQWVSVSGPAELTTE